MPDASSSPDPFEPFDAQGAESADPNASPFSVEPDTRQVVLVKHGQRYVFRYSVGEESHVLKRIVELARDPASDVDWFDAALLSHQIGQGMGRRLESLLKP